jgi:hypothetical protein
MPSRASSQPFVVELEVVSSCTNSDAEECPALQLELGTSATRLVVAGTAAQTVSACVGQAGYGADVMLRVRPALAYHHGELPLPCETTEWPAIDRIAIRPAAEGECADDDALLGGLASSAGWSLTDASITGDRLAIMGGGRAETVVAFSEVANHQALSFRTIGGVGAMPLVELTLDGLAWSRQRPGGDLVCMPEWAAGASHRLGISTIGTTVVTIASLAIVSAPQCGDNAFDATFDRPLRNSSWSNEDGFLPAGPGYEEPGVTLRKNESLRASLRFKEREAYPFAAHVRYRNKSNQTSTIDFALDTSAGETVGGTSWQRRTACLPARWEHQLVTLRLDVSMTPFSPGGLTDLWIDDLGIYFPLPSECE